MFHLHCSPVGVVLPRDSFVICSESWSSQRMQSWTVGRCSNGITMQNTSWLSPLPDLKELNHISALYHQRKLGPEADVQSLFQPYQFYNHVLNLMEVRCEAVMKIWFKFVLWNLWFDSSRMSCMYMVSSNFYTFLFEKLCRILKGCWRNLKRISWSRRKFKFSFWLLFLGW